MKRILLALMAILFLCAPQSHAVLNEGDLSHTLLVLKDELAKLRREQVDNMVSIAMFDKMQHERMVALANRSNELSLILYSQNETYVFNLTYACSEVSKLHREMAGIRRPYDAFLRVLSARIDRYDRLVAALHNLPVAGEHHNHSVKSLPVAGSYVELVDSLAEVPDSIIRSAEHADSVMTALTLNMADRKSFFLTPEQVATRDSCLSLAVAYLGRLKEIESNIRADLDEYDVIAERLSVLNEYAEARYDEIRDGIFRNRDVGFVTMLMGLPYYHRQAVHDIRDKYAVSGEETVSSSWKGPVVVFFAFFSLFYLFVAIVLCNVFYRFLVPSRMKTESLELRKTYIITAGAMLLFSAVLFGFRFAISSSFYQMASSLLIEFSLLMTVIVGSLLFRYAPHVVGHGVRLYLPVMVMGFVVILCRIIFVPSSVVSLVFPVLLVGLAFWQYFVTLRFGHEVPRSDTFYGWISFAVIVVSCVCSWLGYTLLAVQIFTWWMMQLTCIHGLTCLRDASVIYEDKNLRQRIKEAFPGDEAKQEDVMTAYADRTGKFFSITWRADLLNMVVLPLAVVASLPLCVYWAASIFDMTSACMDYYFMDFVDVEDLCSLSAAKIVSVICAYFIFRFISYSLHALYAHAIATSDKKDNKEAHISMANNIISILCWGTYFIFALILLRVPKSGISIVTAGLATGVGFALKDVLNNMIYGVSLMAGRLRVGELIECDGVRGKVESITYQSTQVATLDGGIIAFLNADLFAKNFKNLTRNHEYEFVKLTVGVAYGTNVSVVRDLIQQRIMAIVRRDDDGVFNIDTSRGIAVRIEGFGDNSVDLSISLWARVFGKGRVKGEVNEVVYNTLNENHIEIPFPQRDVHIING